MRDQCPLAVLGDDIVVSQHLVEASAIVAQLLLTQHAQTVTDLTAAQELPLGPDAERRRRLAGEMIRARAQPVLVLFHRGEAAALARARSDLGVDLEPTESADALDRRVEAAPELLVLHRQERQASRV